MKRKFKTLWAKPFRELAKEAQEERELAICTDCDTYEVCPLMNYEERGECEKIKAERGGNKC